MERRDYDAFDDGSSKTKSIILRKSEEIVKVKRHLETLGFVAGGEVRVISQLNGNLIVSIKDSRVAISKEMANKIMV